MEDPWTNAAVDPCNLFQDFPSFDTDTGGAILDLNLYRSITPIDTPKLSMSEPSGPNSEVSGSVELDNNWIYSTSSRSHLDPLESTDSMVR